MFTLSFQRTTLHPRAYYFHAANSASSTLSTPNALNPAFHAAIVPEDVLIMDAASRVLQQTHTIPVGDMTCALNQLWGLAIGPTLIAPVAWVPVAWAPGCLADIQARITPLNVSLSWLHVAYDELVAAGWTGTALTDLGTQIGNMHNTLPGMSDIQGAYQNLEISLNQYHRVTDMHGSLSVLSPGDISTLNHELLAVNGTTIEQFLATITNLDEAILERHLATIQAKPEYRTLITNKASFDKRFLSYFSQVLLERSNTALDVTKESVFADRRGEFEGIVNRSRRVTMEDILTLDPINPTDLDRLHQIFVTNRRYFQRTGNTQMIPSTVRLVNDQYTGQQLIFNAVSTTPAIVPVIDIQIAVAAALATVAHPPATVAAAQAMTHVVDIAARVPWADMVSILTAVQAAMIPVPPVLPAVVLNWDQGMRDRLVAILNRYYPQMIAQYIRPATASRIPGLSTWARTVEWLAEAIMDQNTGENLMYYTDANPIRATENNSGIQTASRFLGYAGEKMQDFFKASTPWVQGFMWAAKKATEVVVGTAGKVASKSANFVGKTIISGTTWFIDKKATFVDAWAWKAREKGFWNTVGWLAKMPARPVTKLAKLLSWSTDGIIGKWVGENMVAKWVNIILIWGTNLTYNTLNDIVAKIPDDEVTDIFSGAGWLLHKSGEWTSRATDLGGNWLFGNLKTRQKREILSSLRRGLDEVGQAGFQSAMFRSTMRNWGIGSTPVAPAVAPVAVTAPAIAPVPPTLPDGQIVVIINTIRTAVHPDISSVLTALAVETGSHPNTPKLLTAYRAAYIEAIRTRHTATRGVPSIDSVIAAALSAI